MFFSLFCVFSLITMVVLVQTSLLHFPDLLIQIVAMSR